MCHRQQLADPGTVEADADAEVADEADEDKDLAISCDVLSRSNAASNAGLVVGEKGWQWVRIESLK